MGPWRHPPGASKQTWLPWLRSGRAERPVRVEADTVTDDQQRRLRAKSSHRRFGAKRTFRPGLTARQLVVKRVRLALRHDPPLAASTTAPT